MLLAAVNPLNTSELIFPALECFHILGFAMSVGTIAIVDFRLLNLGMRHQKVAEVAKDMAPWTIFGLAIMLTSGPLLFSSDPDMYYLNSSFQFKMVCLLLAIIFNYTIHRKAARSETPPPNAKLVACISLLLWAGVIFGGIFIGFVGTGAEG
jgi:Family of unknown function (DUF6644)